MRVRLGTRQSLLAQMQAREVAGHLHDHFPSIEIESVFITTRGDHLSTDPSLAFRTGGVPAPGSPAIIDPGGLKSLFTKEIEDALLAGRIDVAVHSCKDLPAVMAEGLTLAAVPPREDARDVWIARAGKSFDDLLVGARIGTGAVRRQAQISRLRPDLELIPMRGNVDTRLRKLHAEKLDGIVLAAAGIRRMGLDAQITSYFSFREILPAVGQGCLALQVRADDDATLECLKALNHVPSFQAVRAERAFLRALGGTCQTPIGAYAYAEGSRMHLRGLVIHPAGQPVYEGEIDGPLSEPEALGVRLGQQLLARGAIDVLMQK